MTDSNLDRLTLEKIRKSHSPIIASLTASEMRPINLALMGDTPSVNSLVANPHPPKASRLARARTASSSSSKSPSNKVGRNNWIGNKLGKLRNSGSYSSSPTGLDGHNLQSKREPNQLESGMKTPCIGDLSEKTLKFFYSKERLIAQGDAETFDVFEKVWENKRELQFLTDFVQFFNRGNRLNEVNIFFENGSYERVNWISHFFNNYYRSLDVVTAKSSTNIRTKKKKMLNRSGSFHKNKKESIKKKEDEKKKKNELDENDYLKAKVQYEIKKKHEYVFHSEEYKQHFRKLAAAKKKEEETNNIKNHKSKENNNKKQSRKSKLDEKEQNDANMRKIAELDAVDILEGFVKYNRLDLNDVCSTFKQLLIDLSDPILTERNAKNMLDMYIRCTDANQYKKLSKEMFQEVKSMIYPYNFYFCYLIYFFRSVCKRSGTNLVGSRSLAISFATILFKLPGETPEQEMDSLKDKINLLVYLIDSNCQLPYQQKSDSDADSNAKVSKERIEYKAYDFKKYETKIRVGRHTGEKVQLSGPVFDTIAYLSANPNYLINEKLFLYQTNANLLNHVESKMKTTMFRHGPYDILRDLNVNDEHSAVAILKYCMKRQPKLFKIPQSLYTTQLKYIYSCCQQKKINSSDSKFALNLFVLDELGPEGRAHFCLVLDFLGKVMKETLDKRLMIVRIASVFADLMIEYPPEDAMIVQEIFIFLLHRYNALKKTLRKQNPLAKISLSGIFDLKTGDCPSVSTGRMRKAATAGV